MGYKIPPEASFALSLLPNYLL